ncbi:K+ efflux antiporter 6 [Actinidia rufa]|uniref:K+ efflux antiporter 6 n=1 Tax=Actinidia rufa TaxID=165716 RepID=A0A7J0FAZ6_9ERIC|nr:K+ efflux antiporter 6 [Actinidia rufa]
MRTLFSLLVVNLLCFSLFRRTRSLNTADSNQVLVEDNNATVSESNPSRSRSKEDSFAEMIDRALEKEFTENDEQSQGLA